VKESANLKCLQLCGLEVRGDALVQIKGLPIENLEFTGPKTLDDAVTEGLTALPSLTQLGFRETKITDSFLKSLNRLTALRVLVFYGDVRILGAGVEHIAALKNLREIRLEGSPFTATDLAKLQAALPNCKITLSPALQKTMKQ
jgi:hypothetical protein